jgi:hypothetical protein
MSRAIARFKRWFGGAAVAASAQPQDLTQGIDPVSANVILGEIGKQDARPEGSGPGVEHTPR